MRIFTELQILQTSIPFCMEQNSLFFIMHTLHQISYSSQIVKQQVSCIYLYKRHIILSFGSFFFFFFCAIFLFANGIKESKNNSVVSCLKRELLHQWQTAETSNSSWSVPELALPQAPNIFISTPLCPHHGQPRKRFPSSDWGYLSCHHFYEYLESRWIYIYRRAGKMWFSGTSSGVPTPLTSALLGQIQSHTDSSKHRTPE